MNLLKWCVFLGVLTVFNVSVFASTSQKEEQWLQSFEKNPFLKTNEPIEKKWIKKPSSAFQLKPLFSSFEKKSKRFIMIKDQSRLNFLNQNQRSSLNSRRSSFLEPQSEIIFNAPILENDSIENLVDLESNAKTTLAELDLYRSGSLNTLPWTDTYWPLDEGALATRYADSRFPDHWKEAFDYSTRNHPFTSAFSTRNASAIDLLSPAEKYDILIGNTKCRSENLNLLNSDESCFGFTKKNWLKGYPFYKDSGSVESWMGICHGWSPASFMEKSPKNAIILKSPEGIPIRFYPSDMKALASHLWANASYPTKFAGGRCNEKNPPQDSRTGRIQSQDCFDNNPGTFHEAMINQIGITKRGLVFDATYDAEVWNYPIYSFSYKYFNPITKTVTDQMRSALINRNTFTNDPYRSYRSPQTKFIIGVVMNVSYAVEVVPTHKSLISEAPEATQMATYYYDLECDANGKIIGGEWYQKAHPDFLWTPAPLSIAQSESEKLILEDWDIQKPLPLSWQNAAKGAINENSEGLPVRKILEKMLRLSRNENDSTLPTPSPSSECGPCETYSNVSKKCEINSTLPLARSSCPTSTQWDEALQLCVRLGTPPNSTPEKWVCTQTLVGETMDQLFTSFSTKSKTDAIRIAFEMCKSSSCSSACNQNEIRCVLE